MAMVDQALRTYSVGMLKTDGYRLMEKFHAKTWASYRLALNALREEVLEDPDKMTEDIWIKGHWSSYICRKTSASRR